MTILPSGVITARLFIFGRPLISGCHPAEDQSERGDVTEHAEARPKAAIRDDEAPAEHGYAARVCRLVP